MLEKSSDDDVVGFIIVVERAGGGDAGFYQSFSFPHLNPLDDDKKEEQ